MEPSNRKRWIVAAVVVVSALALLGVWRSRSGKAAPTYRTAAVERGDIEALVSATGTVRPVVQVQVGSQVSGTVQRLFADFNDRVRRGQVLLQLDPSSFRARVVQAEAAVARAQAGLQEAQRQHTRAQTLVTQQLIAQAEVESKQAVVQQSQADLRQARAQLQAARVDLAHTTITAPIDGVVIARSVDLGQTVAASLQAPELFLIANDLARMQVETRIDEADVGSVRAGLPVRFTVDAFPEREFEGVVQQVRLQPIEEQGVVTYTTVIHTENPEMLLRPGMTANVSVIADRREGVLRVPNAALRFDPPRTGAQRRGGGSTGSGAAAAAESESRGGGQAWAQGRGGRGDSTRAWGRGGRGDSTRAWGGSGRGDTTRAAGRLRRSASDVEAREDSRLKRGKVYRLENGKPVRVAVQTGITDGSFTEVQGPLEEGTLVIVGMTQAAGARASDLQPPPGMGGRGFGGGGGGRGQGTRR